MLALPIAPRVEVPLPSATMGSMKKLFGPIVLVAGLALTGCAGADAEPAGAVPAVTNDALPVEEVPQAPDLTGDWKQSNSHSDTDFMTATIADGAISIDWELGSEDFTAVYWVGTFEAPVDDTAYAWTSQRDAAATDTALMASTDGTKEFTYRDGLISFTVGIQGESASVELSRN